MTYDIWKKHQARAGRGGDHMWPHPPAAWTVLCLPRPPGAKYTLGDKRYIKVHQVHQDHQVQNTQKCKYQAIHCLSISGRPQKLWQKRLKGKTSWNLWEQMSGSRSCSSCRERRLWCWIRGDDPSRGSSVQKESWWLFARRPGKLKSCHRSVDWRRRKCRKGWKTNKPPYWQTLAFTSTQLKLSTQNDVIWFPNWNSHKSITNCRRN